MRHILLASAALVALAITPAWAKTVRECDAEYSANKAAIQGTQTKAAFVTACRAGSEIIPGAVPVATAPAAPVAPGAVASPAPTRTGFFGSRKPAATAPSAVTAPSGANQFPAAAQAQSRCPAATVVWVNTNSGVYHFAGTKNYGTTKEGAYMCEPDATAAGNRASKTEHHP